MGATLGVLAGIALLLWLSGRDGDAPRAVDATHAAPDREQLPKLLEGSPVPSRVEEASAPPPRATNASPGIPGTEMVGGVEGTVTLWNGTPGAGLEVFLVPADAPVPPRGRGGNYDWNASVQNPEKTRTDTQGRYAMPGRHPEVESAVVVRTSWTHEARSQPVRCVETGPPQRRDVVVPAPATIRLQLAATDGAERVLRQITVRGEFVWFSLPEDSGERLPIPFTFDVDPGRHQLQIWVQDGPFLETTVDVAAGERKDVTLTLPADGIVRGRVIDPQHRSLRHSHVTWSGDRHVSGELDPDGRFRLTGTGPGKGTLRLSLWLVGGDPGPRTPADVEDKDVERKDVVPGGPELEIVLEPDPRIRARMEGVEVGTKMRQKTLSIGVSASGEAVFDGGPLTFVPRAGEPTRIVVWVEDKAPVVLEVPALGPGEERDVGVLRVESGRDLVGRVVVKGGGGLAGADVDVTERWSEARTSTDATGRFVLPHMPSREIPLRVRAKGFPQHFVTVPAGHEGAVEVEVTPGGVVRGRIVDEEGRGVPAAGVAFFTAEDSQYDRDHDKSSRFLRADGEGRFVARVAAGRHHLRASGPDGKRTRDQVVTVSEGGETTLDLVVDQPRER